MVTISRSSSLQTTQYAIGVTSHLIVASKKVYQACQRHLNDLERQGTKGFPYVFDEEKGFRPVQFIEKFCRPSQGDFKLLILQPWQHFIVGSLYGWIHKDTGQRRFRECLIFVGRKNGKTTLVSGLSLYGASKDGENGARVYQLANSMKQARLIFDECKSMVNKSKLLNKHFRPLLHAIHFDKTLSKIEPQASDSERLDGLNCHLGIFDEIHEYKDYKLINVIKNSRSARKQPLLIYITTAGYQLDGPLVEYYEKAANVLEGSNQDERSFYYIAELDEEDDLDDPRNWIKANPNLGVSIDLEEMIGDWETAKQIPKERSDFITKRFNIFVKSGEESFLSYEVIKRNNKEIDITQLYDKSCIGGFDLSDSEDFTSACLEFPITETGEVFVLSHSWIPAAKVFMDNEKIPYREYEEMGLLTIIKGDYVKKEYIYDWFVEQSKRFNIELITYDPAKAFGLVESLTAYGFATELVRQGHLTLGPAMDDAKERFLDGKVIFNNNRLFRWYLNNVKLVDDRNRNKMPTKQGRYRKIDGFAAFLNAHTEVLKVLESAKPTGDIQFVSINELLRR
ncbi:terminase large subunit [Brevibacillus nitrificans]|uniref:Terminase large subunit n=1 Tax=Brevibacillus nitrificans TaxID=651560 RepID=A0A3M8DPU6_9BACL|nr:terminase large subunit [Brevibacillus nitrificans]RNB90166.1 terminase large subunit [Brevibacillus nitrificans]